MTKTTPLSFDHIQSYPLKDRDSKVDVNDFARPWSPGDSMEAWLQNLPNILAAKDLLMIRDRMVEAFFGQKKIILAMGAHAIKVGLNPVIIDLLERGVISGLAMNGACIIHDAELDVHKAHHFELLCQGLGGPGHLINVLLCNTVGGQHTGRISGMNASLFNVLHHAPDNGDFTV